MLVVQDPDIGHKVVDALCGTRDPGFSVQWVRRCEEAVERLTREARGIPYAIDAVLTELNLSDSAGIATLDRLLQAAPRVPILVLSDILGETVAKYAVTRGAQDYLLEGDLNQLPRTAVSMIERARFMAAGRREAERIRTTLESIGDGVISTDKAGDVTYLNAVAERLTGWSNAEAIGRALPQVFHIVDGATRIVGHNPALQAMQEVGTVSLTPNCMLIRRDGHESAIEDSVAPIRDHLGQVTGAVMIFHDVSEARAISLRMSYLAQHDSLTGLPNRVVFNDRLQQAMIAAERQRQRVAVLYLDLDRFKHINDTLGHSMGDDLLRTVAKRLCSCVRTSDTVSRQGGDEFVVLLPQVTAVQDAEVIANNILAALREPWEVDRHALVPMASIGVAIYPDDGVEAAALIRSADLAMYQAKSAGGGTFRSCKSDACKPITARATGFTVPGELRHGAEFGAKDIGRLSVAKGRRG